ncbi:sensor histidine kinase [Kribbella sp. CA-294648]|uniref:sensor histidine kinase n=1 Tax=Kribbella sp. CA-294648 TaxID=3239948 RepID=UPI003D8D7DAF
MEHLRNWLLPAVLGIGWVALTPAMAGALELQLSRPELVLAGVATVVAAVALGFRRRTPLATLGVVTVVAVFGQVAGAPDGSSLLPAELIALYSVAVRCRPAVTWRAAAALVAVLGLTALGLYGLGPEFAVEVVFTVVLSLLVVGGGQNRRRRLAVRERAAQELRDAEERRRSAAAVERRRLARELHDVSAHHLTSIVVSGGAAERLSDRRPELAEEALAYAARTGRETLVSLRRLVAVLGTGHRDQDEPLGARIAELAEAFTRLGQQVRVDVRSEVYGPVAEAVFGIVRESLTNTLRYAPGAAVRVLVTREGDRIHLMVESGRPTGIPSAGQGSGRGIAGMKDRAETLGGTLTAGPAPDGGWRVEATLPSTPLVSHANLYSEAPPPSSAHHRPGGRWRDHWLAELSMVLAVAVAAVAGMAAAISEEVPEADSAAVGLALLLALMPALMLLGRRNRPWTVLIGATLAAWLWPVAIGLDQLPHELAPAVAVCLGGPMAAVYAVAAYGQGTYPTWASVPVAAGGFGVAAGALVFLTPQEADLSGPDFAIFIMVLVSVVLAGPLTACWALGDLARRRRNRRLDHDGRALAELVREAEAEVHGERQRIATGLSGSVLTRTSRMIALAEAGQLESVTTEARSALTAMRELLETLDDPATAAPLAPHPTTPQQTAPEPADPHPTTPHSVQKELFR